MIFNIQKFRTKYIQYKAIITIFLIDQLLRTTTVVTNYIYKKKLLNTLHIYSYGCKKVWEDDSSVLSVEM